MNVTKSELDRFNSKWEKSGDCHLWNGPLDRDGYGTFFFRRLNRRAHRMAWFVAHGDIPDGMVVNHICRNRNCVNPQHLEVCTAGENSKRDSSSLTYVNSRKTHCPQNHPYDRKYGNQRYCSICEAEKRKRLRAKWRAEDTLKI